MMQMRNQLQISILLETTILRQWTMCSLIQIAISIQPESTISNQQTTLRSILLDSVTNRQWLGIRQQRMMLKDQTDRLLQYWELSWEKTAAVAEGGNRSALVTTSFANLR